MLNDVKGKVIRAAEAPDRNADQQHNSDLGMFGNQ
jgi:hypothetical protein